MQHVFERFICEQVSHVQEFWGFKLYQELQFGHSAKSTLLMYFPNLYK